MKKHESTYQNITAPTWQSRALGYLGAAVLLATLIALMVYFYYPSLAYPFEFDDLSNIVKHFSVRHKTIKDLFFANSRWISYWLNTVYYSLLPDGHKFDPYLYRLGNLIIHCWAGAAVFCVACGIIRSRAYALFARVGNLIPFLTAGLFLLHPVQTQTVSYVIQGQLEGLAGACILTTTALLLAYAHSSGVVRALALILLVLSSFFACGSKEIVIVMPVLLVLTDWFFIAQGSWHSLRTRLWLHGVITCIVVGMYLYLLKPQYFTTIMACSMELPSNIGNMITETRLEKITSSAFFISQGKVILHYLWIFIWPWSMSMDYDWKLCSHPFMLDCCVPYLVLALFAGYIAWRWYRNRIDLVSFCFLWFFIAILPRSSIIPSTELLADYKTYTASFGICLLLALGLAQGAVWLYNRYPKFSWPLWYALAFAVLAGVGYLAQRRNLVWESPIAFWEDVIKHAPKRARAYNNYGVALCEKGDNEGAAKNFWHAISLDQFYSDPYANLSVAYTNLARYQDAINAMRRGIAIMPTQPEGYNNLASILISTGNDEEAKVLLETAIKLRPHYGKAHFNLGKWYLKRHRDEEAWECFKKGCMAGDFDNEVGFTMYGHASMTVKKYDEALYAFNRALAMNPTSIDLALRRILAAEQLQRHNDVDAWFHDLLARNAHQPALWVQYGDLLMMRPGASHAVQALSCYERAAKATGASPLIGAKMALACERAGNHERACSLALQVRHAPQLPEQVKRSLDGILG